MREFSNADVMEKFINYPDNIKEKLLFLRELIFDVASSNQEIGKIEETLKWNEPAYNNSKSGSTIRIDWKKSAGDCYMVYFNCKTTLIAEFKILYPDTFRYQGNRAIIIKQNEEVNIEALRHCFYLALTYKIRKKLF